MTIPDVRKVNRDVPINRQVECGVTNPDVRNCRCLSWSPQPGGGGSSAGAILDQPGQDGKLAAGSGHGLRLGLAGPAGAGGEGLQMTPGLGRIPHAAEFTAGSDGVTAGHLG